MIGVPMGLLVPEDFLQSRGFSVFATFVALNTIVYLGLTAAKIVPWPHQVGPDRVRTLLPEPLRQEAHMPSSVTSLRRSAREHDTVNDAFRGRRRDIAVRTIPLALSLLGALTILETALNAALGIPGGPWQYVIQVGLAAIVIAIAQIGARGRIPSIALSWIWVVVVTLAVANLSFDATANDSTVALAYAIVCMTAILPVSVAWGPGLVGATISIAAFATSSIVLTGTTSLRWILAALFGVLLGAVLLYVRRSGIDATTLEQLRANTLATTDPMTGCFSRSGLLSLAPGFAANAERAGESVTVVLAELDELTLINADYGIAYGDDVIETLGRALSAALPAGDLVARWDGRAFLALGMGAHPDDDTLRAALEDRLEASGIALGKRPIAFRVRGVTGDPRSATLESLAQEAANG